MERNKRERFGGGHPPRNVLENWLHSRSKMIGLVILSKTKKKHEVKHN